MIFHLLIAALGRSLPDSAEDRQGGGGAPGFNVPTFSIPFTPNFNFDEFSSPFGSGNSFSQFLSGLGGQGSLSQVSLVPIGILHWKVLFRAGILLSKLNSVSPAGQVREG